MERLSALLANPYHIPPGMVKGSNKGETGLCFAG